MSQNAAYSSSSSITMIDCFNADYGQQLALDVRQGLSGKPKTLPSKYFYDARGSELFEKICMLPEYYLPRCEIEALQQIAPEIVRDVSRADLIELGSGASRKIKVVLEAATKGTRQNMRYVPVDVCGEYLQDSAQELLQHYPELSVLGIVADFTRHLRELPNTRQRLFFFLGSTLGNFPHAEAIAFLSNIAENMKPGDHFLLGLDMLKSKEVLEKAYNDSQGVTAAFNKNILEIINKELNADFATDLFEHLAFFNPKEGRMEMHLQARQDMEVNVADLQMRVPIKKGETIHTEISRKFSAQEIRKMMDKAGFSINRWVTDRQNSFSVLDLVLPQGH